ncbi:unnamed protein product, partial [Closterium sp. NIES-54]
MRAWHLLLHVVAAVSHVGQAHLVDCNGAPVEGQIVQRLRQEVGRLLSCGDVLQRKLPVLHHVLQPGLSPLHVLEVACQPHALGNRDGRLVVHLEDSQRPDVQLPELCKEEVEAASLLASFRGHHILRLGRRQRRAFDALARPGDCGPSVDEHVAVRARPVLLVAGVVGVHVVDQLQRLRSTAELQGGAARVGEVGEAAVDLAPMLVAPHREAAPQLAAREGNVRPRRRRCELQRADSLPVLLLLAFLRLLVVE